MFNTPERKKAARRLHSSRPLPRTRKLVVFLGLGPALAFVDLALVHGTFFFRLFDWKNSRPSDTSHVTEPEGVIFTT